MPVGAASGTFTDAPDDAYYAEPVGWAVDKGITQGTKNTTFDPEGERSVVAPAEKRENVNKMVKEL